LIVDEFGLEPLQVVEALGGEFGVLVDDRFTARRLGVLAAFRRRRGVVQRRDVVRHHRLRRMLLSFRPVGVVRIAEFAGFRIDSALIANDRLLAVELLLRIVLVRIGVRIVRHYFASSSSSTTSASTTSSSDSCDESGSDPFGLSPCEPAAALSA